MKNLILTTIITLVSFVGVFSQETFVGTQYLRVNPDIRRPNLRFDRSSDNLGVVASLTNYKNNYFGLTAEGSANFRGGKSENQLYTVLGGVTLKSRKGKSIQPFVKGLAGISILRTSFNQAKTDVGLAFKPSVGFDVGKGKYKWRVVEVGYLNTNFYGKYQNNLSLSTGLVF